MWKIAVRANEEATDVELKLLPYTFHTKEMATALIMVLNESTSLHHYSIYVR